MVRYSSSSLVQYAVHEVDITPPVGIYLRNWSAATTRRATGVHRPLLGKILALGSREEQVVLVSLDLGWWMSADDEAQLRAAVIEATGLRAEAVIVCLTHTHSGPSLSRADAAEPGGELITPWLDRIAADLAQGARDALRDLQPGTLDFEVGSSDLATNRDLPLSDGSVVCGYNRGESALNRLLVGRISDGTGRTRVVLAQYAAHPTSLGPGNTLLSPDYVGAARELVESSTGASFVFVQGPSGELAPREQYAANVEVADKNGRVLGYSTLAVLERMPPVGDTVLFDRVLQSGAPLALTKLERVATEALVSARSVLVELRTQNNRPPEDSSVSAAVAADRAVRASRVSGNVGNSGTVPFTVTLWRLGDVVVVAHPGEAYSDLQAALQTQFPDLIIAVVNLANGAHQGYLPPEYAYHDHRYQSWQSPLAAGSLETLVLHLGATLRDSAYTPTTLTPTA